MIELVLYITWYRAEILTNYNVDDILYLRYLLECMCEFMQFREFISLYAVFVMYRRSFSGRFGLGLRLSVGWLNYPLRFDWNKSRTLVSVYLPTTKTNNIYIYISSDP